MSKTTFTLTSRMGPSANGGLLLAVFIHGLLAVTEAGHIDVNGYVDGNVSLTCVYTGTASTDSIVWFRLNNGARTQIAYRNRNGLNTTDIDSSLSGRLTFTNMDSDLKDASLTISNLEMQDEGDFVCLFSALDTREIIFTLILYIPPTATLEMNPTCLLEGPSEMVAATCVAWYGKPAGLVIWAEHPNVGRISQNFEYNFNGTETLTSQYLMVPTRENHGRNLTCRVQHPALMAAVNLHVSLNICYPPKVTITGYTNDWSEGDEGRLSCEAEANPAVTAYTWSKDSAAITEAKDKVLVLPSLAASHSGTFSCRAVNSAGEGTAQINVTVHSGETRSASPLRAIRLLVAAMLVQSIARAH